MALATPSIFGQIVTGHDVEQLTLALFKRWFGTYLSEVERQHGMVAGTLARPRAWVIAPSFDKWPEDQLPAVIVVSVGLADTPHKRGDGSYWTRWDTVVGAVCSAKTQQESRLMSMFYVAALRTLLVQRPGLDSIGEAVDWLDEDYTLLEFSDERSLAAGAGRFELEVHDVVSAKAGPTRPDVPLVPDTDPWPPWATIQTVETDVLVEGAASTQP